MNQRTCQADSSHVSPSAVARRAEQSSGDRSSLGTLIQTFEDTVNKPSPRIVVTFPQNEMDTLKKFCEKTGMRLAEVIRRGVQEYIRKNK